jgi:hypothetical protein
MDRARTLPGAWPRRLALGLTIALLVAGCGSAEGGTSGGSDAGQIIAEIQGVFGTSMSGGALDGDTITITIDNNFTANGAKLFMCSNIKDIVERHGATDVLGVVLVNEKGVQLSTIADCR